MKRMILFMVTILFVTGYVFAEGPWIMEYYALESIPISVGHAEAIAIDYLDQIFGVPEASFSVNFANTTIPGKISWEGEEGDITEAGGVYTIKAGGADIWGTADAFRFTYLELSGDFEISLKAESIEKTNDWAKVGPMVRQSTEPGSQYTFMLARAADGNKYFQERMATGGSASGNGGSKEDGAGFPVYLKITRKGNDFTGSVSADGATWEDVGTTTLELTDPVLVGVAVTSHSTGNITTAVVSDLKINGADPGLAGLKSEDIGIKFSGSKDMTWRVANLGDVNDSRNLSNGIYEGVNGDMSNYCFYGIVGVISPKAQDTVLHVAQDDNARVWINGELVAESIGWTGGPTNTNPFDVSLNSGMNLMLVKVTEGGGGDYLNMRFDAEDLDFLPKNGDIGILPSSVNPKDKLPVMWGEIK